MLSCGSWLVPRPVSDKTRRALAHVAEGQSAYSAAKAEGIALSTIYRALKRERDKGEK